MSWFSLRRKADPSPLDEEIRAMRGNLATAVVNNDRKSCDLREILAERALQEILADRQG